MSDSPFSFSRRSCGVLLHPTSLPGHFGSGDLGPAAYRFADFLAEAGQTWWQMLPVNPPGDRPGNSPYSSTSAFAGSAYLISLDLLHRDGLLEKSDLAPEGNLNGHAIAQFDAGHAFRETRLRRAFARFDRDASRRNQLARFVKKHGAAWLDDWSLYAAIRGTRNNECWTSWPRGLRLREPNAMRDVRIELADEVRFQHFVQFTFEQQWTALHEHCRSRGVALIGDIPIFVGHDSADCWAHRHLFLLDANGNPKATSGYPPDIFNSAGQSWGHPQYRWPAHEKESFAWWVARFARVFQQFDAVRIDHFLGFTRTWYVPADSNDARKGRWVASPGKKLFAAVARKMSIANVIAEDLGQLTPQAVALRDEFGFPGMRIMQFGFGKGGQYHLPHTYPRNCVAYTGTHDNQTMIGWLDDLRDDVNAERKAGRRKRAGDTRSDEYAKAQHYLQLGVDARDDNWKFIRALYASAANTIILPAQDVIGLGADSRMNVPGTADGNWLWRLTAGQLTSAHADRLYELCDLFDRCNETIQQEHERQRFRKQVARRVESAPAAIRRKPARQAT